VVINALDVDFGTGFFIVKIRGFLTVARAAFIA